MESRLRSDRSPKANPTRPLAVAALLLLGILVGACFDGTSRSVECDPGSGDVELVNTVGGVDQEYWLVAPVDRSEAKPLWLLLPGAFGDHEPAYLGWAPYLRKADAFVAFPNLRGKSREVDVVAALIDEIASVYCVDTSRVYAIGSSGSSGFTGELMEELSDRIAAFAVGLGGFGSMSEVTPAVPFWAWTGTTDRVTTETAAELWAQRNGCDPDPQIEELGSGIQHWHYVGCDAPAEYYYFDGMGHQVPVAECLPGDIYCAEYPEVDFVREVSTFFDQHPLSDR